MKKQLKNVFVNSLLVAVAVGMVFHLNGIASASERQNSKETELKKEIVVVPDSIPLTVKQVRIQKQR